MVKDQVKSFKHLKPLHAEILRDLFVDQSENLFIYQSDFCHF